MAGDLFDLEEKVRDYLAELFPANVPGRLFLAFETFGASLPVELFRLQPNGPFLPEMVIEQLTKVADDVPLVDARDYHRTLRKVAAQYKMLLAGAQILPDSPVANITLFEAIKSEAKTLCENGTRGSFAPEPIPYLPVIGQPGNWYEPSATNWREVQFEMGSAAAPVPPPLAPHLEPSIRQSSQFLRPARLMTITEREEVSWTMMVPKPVANPSTNPAPALPIDRSVIRPRSFSMGAARPDLIRVTQLRRGDPVVAGAFTADNRLRERIFRIRPEFIAALEGTVATPPPPSDSLEIAFEVLAVELDRPWIHMPFLDQRGWYVPGYRAGEFTTTELLPAIPTGMVLIRNLRITAKGSADARLSHAVSFGPFELTDKTSEVRDESGRYHVSVKVTGVQIMAWVGQVLPPLPPASDPSLPKDSPVNGTSATVFRLTD